MSDYGVQPTGFVRKPLAVILSEIETAMITEFGPGVIQTSQSPLGQINGLMADYVTQLWEQAEDVYQSYDPDQAEGTRLDILARLRLLERSSDESDIDFRKAVTNAGRARIDLQDLARAIRGLPGVTYTQVFVNDSGEVDANGMAPNTVAVAAIGGSDDDITVAMRQYIVPGIGTFGNVTVATNIEGFCRSFRVIRPITVRVELAVEVRTRFDALGCPPPAIGSIKAAIVERIQLINGENVSWFKIRQIIESLFPTVEVVSVTGTRDGIPENQQGINQDVNIAFLEIATIASEDVDIEVIE